MQNISFYNEILECIKHNVTEESLSLMKGQLGPSSGPEVIKPFSCSTQLSMKFVLLINLKLLSIPNTFLLNMAEHENFSANKYENANLLAFSYLLAGNFSCSAELNMKNVL